jgi:UDP-N-acetylglucosamine acyltransferase
MANIIHPTAIIDDGVQLGDRLKIGPYSIIENDVIIGDDVEIASHVLVASGTRIGRNCRVFQGAVLGTIPQDLKFDKEKTLLEIGDHTTIREYATLNRGTAEHGKTLIGSHCMIMAYVHVAHDCEIGDHVVLSNLVQMAGHVIIEEHVGIGGFVPIHQFVRIGKHAFIGGGSHVSKDVPPYVLAMGQPLRYGGLNLVGLKRKGFASDILAQLKQVYTLFYRSNLTVDAAVKRIKNEIEQNPEVLHILSFIAGSERGLIR